MLNKVKDFYIGDSGLATASTNQTFLQIDEGLFNPGSFSQIVKKYFVENWVEGYDEDDAVVRWSNENTETAWYDIRKDAKGNYYYVVGDHTGIVYFESVDSILIIYDGCEVRFSEDKDSYYIQILGGRLCEDEYLKTENFSLEDAIKSEIKRYEKE